MLEARDLSFDYDGNRPIIEGWEALFEAGDVVAITGQSGRGKSTLLYLLELLRSYSRPCAVGVSPLKLLFASHRSSRDQEKQ